MNLVMDTILVIDDVPDSIKILLDFLGDAGFKVIIAHNGEEGIEIGVFAHPDLILLDIMMPDIDGFEVCKNFKSHPDLKNIPIIFITALNETISKIKGFELGAADYITKPFHYEEVLARVTTHLKFYKLQQELSQQNQQFKQLNEQLQQELTKRKQAEREREQALEALQAEKASLDKRIEERTAELTRALCLKDEFLAAISHEFRTPLTAILGISESLQELFYGPLNEKQLKSLHIIEDSGHHLLTLINELLDFINIKAGKLTLKFKTVLVHQICQQSLQNVQKAANRKHILISTRLDQAIDTIQVDERRLTQILVNLLSNAIKFTPEGGSVKLEVNGNIEQNLVDFTIQDTGIGIAEKDIKYLFKKFVQLNGGVNRTQEGLGLGLSLVYRLVEMHGGNISIESELGKGSCFTVSLPWHLESHSSL